MPKGKSIVIEPHTVNTLGYSYYAFCIEMALTHIERARELMKDDVVDSNHELPLIESKLRDAYAAI